MLLFGGSVTAIEKKLVPYLCVMSVRLKEAGVQNHRATGMCERADIDDLGVGKK